MTVRCQLLVLLFLVSSVVSGPTRSAAESSDGSSSEPEPGPEAPDEAVTSQQQETPATIQEPLMASTETIVAVPPETTTKAGPQVGAKISFAEPSTDGVAIAPLTEPPSSETAPSVPMEVSAKQTSSEEPSATDQGRCAEPAAGVTDGSATVACGYPGSKDTEGGSADNSCIVDDHEYPDGARVPGPQDSCRPCFCHRRRVTCVELRCYTRKGCKPLFKAGVCCPTYDHCPPAMVNASGEIPGNPGDPEEGTTDQFTEETGAGPAAHLVDSSAEEDDSEDESKSEHDQDDDDGDDHDHSHHNHRQHHMLDPVTPLTSSAATLRPSTSFPFLVRGRAGVEVR